MPLSIEIRCPTLDTRVKIDIPGDEQADLQRAVAIFAPGNTISLCRRVLHTFPDYEEFIARAQKEGKPLDKLATDYERRSRVMGKKREAREGAVEEDSGRGKGKGGKFGGGKGKPGLAKRGGKPAGRVKSELKSAEQIRRDRALAEKKRAKNARAPRKGKGAGKGRR